MLKRVLATRSTDPLFAQLFMDEARLAAQLQHPNIAQVYDVGKLDGATFFTMEYVHGEDIRALLRKLVLQKKKLPENLALFIARDALAALHHAHERKGPDGRHLGIIHRDVSLSNIMVSEEGAVKLLDFGVAKANQSTKKQESRPGSMKGKVSYLSPEQCQGTPIDRRSDIFSLGVLLHEMLTQKRLYNRETDFKTMLAITTEAPPPPSQKRPGLSSEIDRIVMTALEKDPEKRYPTAAAMLEEIEAVAAMERHMLTASAMARFMTELFGKKPEPWIELEKKALHDGVPLNVDDLVVEADDLKALGTQLELAPDLAEQVASLRRSQPLDAMPSSVDTPVSNDALDNDIPNLPPAPKSRRRLAIIAGSVIAVGIAAALIVPRMMSSSKATGSADAAQLAATPDAAAAVEPVDAAAEVPATIAAAAEKSDWATVYQRCAAADPGTLDDNDFKHCGIAACSRKQRATALDYFEKTSKTNQPAIERACKEQGIALAKATKPTGRDTKPPPRDPCKDPAYVEKNPLRCQ